LPPGSCGKQQRRRQDGSENEIKALALDHCVSPEKTDWTQRNQQSRYDPDHLHGSRSFMYLPMAGKLKQQKLGTDHENGTIKNRQFFNE
jgi:hypothetical protein